MSVYGRDFAEVYSKYGYAEFSANVADLMPRVLARLRAKPKEILDVPCGEGTFSIKMAKKGFRVTGVDRSEGMLGVARRKGRSSRAKVRFLKDDMRALHFQGEFDLVTSWYDSLNYLLRAEDLRAAFRSVFRALRPGGLFLFDMNSLRTLSKSWVPSQFRRGGHPGGVRPPSLPMGRAKTGGGSEGDPLRAPQYELETSRRTPSGASVHAPANSRIPEASRFHGTHVLGKHPPTDSPTRRS